MKFVVDVSVFQGVKTNKGENSAKCLLKIQKNMAHLILLDKGQMEKLQTIRREADYNTVLGQTLDAWIIELWSQNRLKFYDVDVRCLYDDFQAHPHRNIIHSGLLCASLAIQHGDQIVLFNSAFSQDCYILSVDWSHYYRSSDERNFNWRDSADPNTLEWIDTLSPEMHA